MTRRITGTLKVNLDKHPFGAGETLWTYATRQLREAGLTEVHLADVSAGVRKVGPQTEWVIIDYNVPREGDDTNDN